MMQEHPSGTGELRRCSTCKLLKPLDTFAFADIQTGARQYNCRACHAKLRRAHYEQNRDDYIRRAEEQTERRRAYNRERIVEYLRAHSCVDCGETDLIVLEFDHRDPASKHRDVTWLAARRRWPIVSAEIEKCDVRCANCHRRRTAMQFGWTRTLRYDEDIARE